MLRLFITLALVLGVTPLSVLSQNFDPDPWDKEADGGLAWVID